MADEQSQVQAVSGEDEEDTRALNGKGKPIDGTRKNADGTVTLFLELPITVMNFPTDKITIKRPRGKEMRGLDSEEGDVQTSLKYLATLANIPPACVLQLDSADIQAAGEVLKGFMRKTRVAGGN
jgi:hypothetical protein